jgi:hypothetical protein
MVFLENFRFCQKHVTLSCEYNRFPKSDKFPAGFVKTQVFFFCFVVMLRDSLRVKSTPNHPLRVAVRLGRPRRSSSAAPRLPLSNWLTNTLASRLCRIDGKAVATGWDTRRIEFPYVYTASHDPQSISREVHFGDRA